MFVQFVQASGIVVSLFTLRVEQSQSGGTPIRNENGEPAATPDGWEVWVQVGLLLSLLVPFAFIYLPSDGLMHDLAMCVSVQWFLKMLCFVGFPREIITVPTN